MQITIEISDELAARAQARGLTPESYVRSLLDDTARNAPLPLPPANPKIDMSTFLREMAAHSGEIPQLPDEAFTRESFYQDHD
jgi:antitoxin component of RelBE/YafQ-DinJ toxin-antitoxin module